MTETLHTLLHERAERADLAPVDLDRVVRDGGRAVVRRRRSITAGVVAALVGTAGVGMGALGGDRDRRPTERPPEISSTADGISWAEGSVIHDGASTLDVGHTIGRYVSTSVGYVFTDGHGQVWSAHDGTVESVGTTVGRLVSDPDGTLAGWADTSGKRLVYAVLDQSTGMVATFQGHARPLAVAPGILLEGGMIGVDGRTAVWRDDDSYYRAELWTDGTPLPETIPPGNAVIGVGAGLLLEQEPQTGRIWVVRPGSRTSLGTPNGTPLVAPGGDWVAFGSDASGTPVDVYDTRSGDAVTLDIDAFRAVATQWLDDETVVLMVAPAEDADYQLWRCAVPEGRCAVAVADLGSGPTTSRGNGLRFALPIGDVWFPYPHG